MSKSVMRIEVFNNYGGKPSNGERIEPGFYYEDDPALFGLSDYLVTNGHARYIGATPRHIAEFVSAESSPPAAPIELSVEEWLEKASALMKAQGFAVSAVGAPLTTLAPAAEPSLSSDDSGELPAEAVSGEPSETAKAEAVTADATENAAPKGKKAK